MKTVLIIVGCLLASIAVLIVLSAMWISGKESRHEEHHSDRL